MTPVVATTASEFATRVLKLHEFIAAGKGDDSDADLLRGEMEVYWRSLTEVEQERFRHLSADLYVITEGGVRSIQMTAEARAQWAKQFRACHEKGEWDGVLAVLRSPPEPVPKDLVAFMQARCWENLGFVEVALVFMKEAARLHPVNDLFVLVYLQRLALKGEALECAERIIRDQSSLPEALYVAAVEVIASTKDKPLTDIKQTLEQVAQGLRKALTAFLEHPDQRLLPEIERQIVAALALCFERLGKRQSELQLYSDVLTRAPNDVDALTWRGIKLLESGNKDERQKALQDFMKAVMLGCSTVWPWFFMAQDALEHHKYLDCLRLTNRAIELTDRNEVLAQLHEWQGISFTMLGQPATIALGSFDRAIQLDPQNEAILENRRTAERVIAVRKKDAVVWSGRPEALAQKPRLELPEPATSLYGMREEQRHLAALANAI